VKQLKEALQTRIELLSENSEESVETLILLGEIYRSSGDVKRCEDLAGRAHRILSTRLPDERELLGLSKLVLGNCVQRQGRTAEALPLLRESYFLLLSTLGEDNPKTLNAGVGLAAGLRASGEVDEAETLLRDVIIRQRAVLGSTSMEVARSLNNLAYLLRTREDFAGAEKSYREALEIQAKRLPAHHADRIRVLQNLSAVLFHQGKLDETEDTLRRIVELRRQAHPDGHTSIASALVTGLGRFLLDEGRYREAQPVLGEGLDILEASLGPEHTRTAAARGCLGLAHLGAGEAGEGRRLVAESLAVLKAAPEIPYSEEFSVRHLAQQLTTAGYEELGHPFLSLLESQESGEKNPG
jgi:tetratricopeptide (TPR) repeat protein